MLGGIAIHRHLIMLGAEWACSLDPLELEEKGGSIVSRRSAVVIKKKTRKEKKNSLAPLASIRWTGRTDRLCRHAGVGYWWPSVVATLSLSPGLGVVGTSSTLGLG